MSRLRRLRFAATPLHARPTQVRRALGRTRLGSFLKKRRRVGRPETVPASRSRAPAPARAGKNLLFVSHCDFTGNSAYHVHALARELARRGWSPAVAVPGSTRGARELGRVHFPILSFRAVRRGALRFSDGRGVDLVHAFTPRAHVRSLAREVGAPYVVHLEDNEAAVRSALRGADDTEAQAEFVAAASGVTVVVEKLLELKPDGVPGAVVWPGYDEAIDAPGRPRDEIRRDIGLKPDDVAIVYTGNVHEANLEDVCALYEAVRRLRADGRNVVLVKSGWNSVGSRRLPDLDRRALRDLGWIRRSRVHELLRAADVFVQPGAPGAFNDYRFPSKVSDYLASGIPVVLPHANIGLELDASCAAVLRSGDAAEISANVVALLDDREAAARVGSGGRRFAVARLTWACASAAVERLYRRLPTEM